MYPPSVWAEIPSNFRRTNNGPEAFHSHYNEQFYSSHSSTFVFLDTLTKIQPTTYIKIRSTSSEAARSRHDYEKENFAMEKYQKLLRGEISRKQYVSVQGRIQGGGGGGGAAPGAPPPPKIGKDMIFLS